MYFVNLQVDEEITLEQMLLKKYPHLMAKLRADYPDDSAYQLQMEKQYPYEFEQFRREQVHIAHSKQNRADILHPQNLDEGCGVEIFFFQNKRLGILYQMLFFRVSADEISKSYGNLKILKNKITGSTGNGENEIFLK